MKEGTVPVPQDRPCAVRWYCYQELPHPKEPERRE